MKMVLKNWTMKPKVRAFRYTYIQICIQTHIYTHGMQLCEEVVVTRKEEDLPEEAVLLGQGANEECNDKVGCSVSRK